MYDWYLNFALVVPSNRAYFSTTYTAGFIIATLPTAGFINFYLTFIDRMVSWAAPTLRRTTFFFFWNHFERTPAEFERTKKYAEYAGGEALGASTAVAAPEAGEMSASSFR